MAPAIGDPIRDENDERPQDMPVLVPRRRGSGHKFGNTAAGKVTRPAEQNPQNALYAIRPFCVDTAIQHKQRTPETAAQQNHVNVGPRWWAIRPADSRPKKDAAI